MTPAEQCAHYFRQHPAFHRLLAQMLGKFKSYGAPRGRVNLPDATPEECEAARGWFGRPFTPPLRFSLADFEEALGRTCFGEASLQQVLECYFGAAIQTRRQQSEQLDSQIAAVLQRLEGQVASGPCRRWLHTLAQGSGEGYPLLRKDPQRGETAMLQACHGVDWLDSHKEHPPLRLAVLAANATTDPHALDGNTLSGKFFLHLLSHSAGTPFPTSTEERAQLYSKYGILQDSISSTVTQLGLRLYCGTEEHPAHRAFRQLREIDTLTLANLSALTGGDSPSGQVYLVENQMVFSQLCDHAAAFRSPLICTSGQPTLAVLELLRLLVQSGTVLHYSGDFDGKGLSIAGQLLQRFPHLLRLWHMSPEDYQLACSDVPLSPDSRAMVADCVTSTLSPTAQAILNCGRVGYQELILPQLLDDLTRDKME